MNNRNHNSVEATRSTSKTPQTTSSRIEIPCNDRIAEAYILSQSTDTVERAIEEYKSVIENGCDNERSRLEYGLTLAGTKRWEEAAEQYRIVISQNPKNWAAHWTLAQTLILELQQYEEGLEEVEKSKQLDDLDDIGYVYDYYYGRAYEGLNKHREALKHYEIYAESQSSVHKNEPKLIDAQKRIENLKKQMRS